VRVSIVINPKAGSVNPKLIEEKIRQALFRCDLVFAKSKNLEEMGQFLSEEMAQKTDYFLICGGDGTVNTCLQFLMKTQDDFTKIPPIAVVRSGTANDLAHEIGISHRIDQAVRNILEGEVTNIDIIQISSGDKKVFMLTNGGLGIPALTADLANQLRSGLQKVSTCPKTAGLFKLLAKNGYQAVKKIGPGIYSMMVAEALRTWEQKGWELEFEIPGFKTFITKAPIVLISNQPSIGNKFLPAPFTSNTDGTVNLLLSKSLKISEHLAAFWHLKKGTVNKSDSFKSYELKEFKIRSTNPKRPMTFFGDGEILFKDVAELSIKCLHKGLPVVIGTSPWQK
jgi:diacylglycerol kinase family enzyme